MEDLISRKGLYEKTVALEKEAMEHCLKLAREDGDPTDRMIWQAITAERAAFKHLICDEPPAKQWTPCSEGLPANHGQVWCTYADGTMGLCHFDAQEKIFVSGFEVVAWMPKPAPYQGKEREAKK